MEVQCSPYYFQELEELKQSLLYSAVEEISRKDNEILQLKSLLSTIIKDRDEFQRLCQQLIDSTNDHDDNHALSPSDDNTAAAPPSPSLPPTPPLPPIKLKALPEQGKFLLAVVEAGPLLQTLLLAGPLPQWQHPPPQLSSVDIPPVTMSNLLLQDSPVV